MRTQEATHALSIPEHHNSSYSKVPKPPEAVKASNVIETSSSPQQTLTQTKEVITGKTFFKDMLTFSRRQCADRRLTPMAQLLLHTLCIIANRNYWAYPFEASRDELKRLMHVDSNDTIDRAKRQLKNFGYVDFYGKPAKFFIYRPTGNRQGGEEGDTGTPKPPIKHTLTPTYNTDISALAVTLDEDEGDELAHLRHELELLTNQDS